MEILIATSNEAKIKKYSTILKELGIQYKTLKELNLNIDVNENGTTPKENSIIKANIYYKATNMPIIVDDCGLIIDKLPENRQPGVMVRRHNGKRLTDEEMIKFYSKELQEVGGESTGGFEIAISIVDEHGQLHTNVLRHNRLFISKPCKERTPGYPMNSLIYNKETKKYLAQKYEGKEMYKGNSFENDFEFIKSVVGGKNEK